jgi:hypothetical protein
MKEPIVAIGLISAEALVSFQGDEKDLMLDLLRSTTFERDDVDRDSIELTGYTICRDEWRAHAVGVHAQWTPHTFPVVLFGLAYRVERSSARLTRHERLQAAADAGIDTGEDYRGER